VPRCIYFCSTAHATMSLTLLCLLHAVTHFLTGNHTFALFFGAPQSLRRILRNPSPRKAVSQPLAYISVVTSPQVTFPRVSGPESFRPRLCFPALSSLRLQQLVLSGFYFCLVECTEHSSFLLTVSGYPVPSDFQSDLLSSANTSASRAKCYYYNCFYNTLLFPAARLHARQWLEDRCDGVTCSGTRPASGVEDSPGWRRVGLCPSPAPQVPPSTPGTRGDLHHPWLRSSSPVLRQPVDGQATQQLASHPTPRVTHYIYNLYSVWMLSRGLKHVAGVQGYRARERIHVFTNQAPLRNVHGSTGLHIHVRVPEPL
jgi:hypothetical protein